MINSPKQKYIREGVALQAARQLQRTSKQVPSRELPTGHLPAMTLTARRLKINLLAQASAMLGSERQISCLLLFPPLGSPLPTQLPRHTHAA